MTETIFLDANATTATDPRVIEAMLPWLSRPANSHAGNAFGHEAEQAVERARHQVATLVGALPEEIVFVPSATFAANLALRSWARSGTVAVRSSIEHACVIRTLEDLEPAVTVSEVPVDENGVLDPEAVAEAADDASVVAVMAVNNEIGTVQPIEEIGRSCDYLGVPFFVDLAQALGRIEIDVHGTRIGGAALSSHKVYGPQGIGALFCRNDLLRTIRPMTTGGGQERRLSPGTLPTALCVGFGAACEIASSVMASESDRLRGLRDLLLRLLREGIPALEVNGSMDKRVGNNLNVRVPEVEAEELLAHLPQIVASTGSACNSGALAPSHVLAALGLDHGQLRSSVRFGLHRFSDEHQVRSAARMICDAANELRGDTSVRRSGARR